MLRASFQIVVSQSTPDVLVIRDTGRGVSVTNDAEAVVQAVAEYLRGRKLLYYDSEGVLDELCVRDGEFAGFAPGPKGGLR